MEEKVRVLVSGKVQGIGYRRFVERYAKMLGLRGYVRNLPGNKVEAILCGEKDDVEKMIEIMRSNHPLAEIEDFKVEKVDMEMDFPDFRIIF
jgi:acylphosphatase